MDKKKTYGQTIIDHREKNLTLDDDIIEYRRQMEQEVLDNIFHTVTHSKTQPIYHNKSFYVVCLFKVERIGQAPRTIVFSRRSCPTPTYKQAVWKYNHQSDSIDFLWSIPDAILYHHILRNQQKYLTDPATNLIAKFTILLENGDLLKWVKKENGEKIDAVIRINTNQENECLIH